MAKEVTLHEAILGHINTCKAAMNYANSSAYSTPRQKQECKDELQSATNMLDDPMAFIQYQSNQFMYSSI